MALPRGEKRQNSDEKHFFNHLSLLLSFILLIVLVFPAGTTLEATLIALCDDLMNMIPTVAFLLVATASVVYAIGNLMPSEFRARAHVWAISCLVGAIIGCIMLIVVPTILGALIRAGLSGSSSSITIPSSSGMCGTKIRDMLTGSP